MINNYKFIQSVCLSTSPRDLHVDGYKNFRTIDYCVKQCKQNIYKKMKIEVKPYTTKNIKLKCDHHQR